MKENSMNPTVQTPWNIALLIGTTQFREGRPRLRVKSVFKYLKGDHVGGRLDFYFGP